jgi:nucleotide-binding universal stress UspA family protein
MYKKIMVPLDGSKLAECVLPHVETIANGCSVVEVVFVRAFELFYRLSGFTEVTYSDAGINKINLARRNAAKDYLNKVMSQGKYGAAILKSEVIAGKIAESLAEYATKNKVDLIVIATHGSSGVSRWVWGSVADRILRSACVPVLMVRAPGCVPVI